MLQHLNMEPILDENSTEPDFNKRRQMPSAAFKNLLLPNTSEKIKLEAQQSGTRFVASVNIKPGMINEQ